MVFPWNQIVDNMYFWQPTIIREAMHNNNIFVHNNNIFVHGEHLFIEGSMI